jgi:hypothetical protein
MADRKRPDLIARRGKEEDKRGTRGLAFAVDYAYLACIKNPVPFRGTRVGIKVLQR